MKGRLARIAQHVPLVAAGEGHADQPVDRRAHLANRIQFVVDDLRIGIERLEQIAVEPAEIAVDLFPLLNFLDPVDRRGLALVKRAGNFFAAQFDHFRSQIVAQRRQMGAGARGDAACDVPAIDDHYPMPFTASS